MWRLSISVEYEYNDESLKRHGVSHLDVGEVLDERNMTTREFGMSLSRNDHLRVMFVGYNFAGRLLEIAVEFINEDKAYVFHGQTVSPGYRKLYEDKE